MFVAKCWFSFFLGEGGRSGRIPVSGCNKLRCLNMIIMIIKIFMINCHNQLSWIIIVIIIIIMTNYHGYQDFQWALKSWLSVNMILSQSPEPEHDFHTYHNYHDKPIWFLIFQHQGCEHWPRGFGFTSPARQFWGREKNTLPSGIRLELMIKMIRSKDFHNWTMITMINTQSGLGWVLHIHIPNK